MNSEKGQLKVSNVDGRNLLEEVINGKTCEGKGPNPSRIQKLMEERKPEHPNFRKLSRSKFDRTRHQ